MLNDKPKGTTRIENKQKELPLPRQDNVRNAVMVHLSRPAEFEASDKVYMGNVLQKHPDLAEFIYEHVYCEATNTEHLILAAFIFELAKVKTTLLKDCKFNIVQYVDRQGERMNLQEHAKQLMAKVTKDAEVIG